jgi:hypothetical protein
MKKPKPVSDYNVHIDGDGPMTPELQAELDKMASLLRKKELIRTGNAGVNKQGVIVDIRTNTNAVPIPKA